MASHLSRRAVLGWLATGACPLAAAQGAASWPTGIVTIIVPAPPGGALDVFVRALAQALGQALGQRFLVDNRVGAGGLIAARVAAQSRPDGHTLVCIHSGFVTLQAMDEQGGPLTVLRPIAKLSRSALVVTVRGDAPYRSLGDLIGAVQGRPGGLTYASGGIGSPAHIAVLRLAGIVGRFDAVHVPYKGAFEGDLAVAAGEVDFHVGPVGTALSSVRSGRVRALAVTSRQRLPALPSVATAGESGVPDFVIEPWVGLAAPWPNSEPAVARLSEALRRIMELPATAQQVQSLAGVPDFADPASFSAQIARELETERELVRRLTPGLPR
jgi:tripartite-type tricarboxylate transporter receptor subunit TctC